MHTPYIFRLLLSASEKAKGSWPTWLEFVMGSWCCTHAEQKGTTCYWSSLYYPPLLMSVLPCFVGTSVDRLIPKGFNGSQVRRYAEKSISSRGRRGCFKFNHLGKRYDVCNRPWSWSLAEAKVETLCWQFNNQAFSVAPNYLHYFAYTVPTR